MDGDVVRVVIADDHALFRKGVRALLDTVPGLQLVAEAADGEDAVKAVVLERPQVLLLDLRMPGMDGMQALEKLRIAAPDVAVVMLTMVSDTDAVTEAVRAGAVGYVLKDAEQEELVNVIHAAARGELLFGASIANHARTLLQAPAGPWAPPLPQLSERERSVLDLFAAGGAVAAIAAALHLSEKSVRNHLTAIPRRLGVATRDEAVVLARKSGLGRQR